MKLVKLLIASTAICVSSQTMAMSDGGAAILGIIIGSSMANRQHQPVVVQQPPVVVYQQNPYQIRPVDPCAGFYDFEGKAYCQGMVERQRREAYERGLYGR